MLGKRGIWDGGPDLLKVLLIESCPQTREVLSDLLEALGYDVTAVADARAALRRRDLPDVILAELDSPDGAARDALLELRCRCGWGEIPAFGLASNDRSPEALAAGRYGFRRVLQKPIQVQELNEILRSMQISRYRIAA